MEFTTEILTIIKISIALSMIAIVIAFIVHQTIVYREEGYNENEEL